MDNAQQSNSITSSSTMTNEWILKRFVVGDVKLAINKRQKKKKQVK